MILFLMIGPNILALIILSLLILLIVRNPILTREHSFSYYALVIAVLVIVFLETCVVLLRPVDYIPYLLVYLLSFVLKPLVPLFFAKVIFPTFINFRTKWFLLPFLLHLIVSASNPLTGWYFSLSEAEGIIRGTLYEMRYIFIVYTYCLIYYASFKASKEYAQADRFYFYIPATVTVSCNIVQLVVPTLLLGWGGLAIDMLYY